MPKTSVLIAARNERHLPRMIAHLHTRLTGDYEIVVVQDGGPYQALPEHPRLRVFNREHQGLKPSINFAAAQATGEYLLKLDSHCAVSEGIDEILPQTMEPNWMVVPRFYTLDEATWAPDARKPHNDYWLLDCPLTDPRGYRFRAGGYWFERTRARAEISPLDETLTHHGSGWFVRRDFFLDKLRGMQSEGYGVSYMEPADLGLRMWLGPWEGAVMVNKACWYGHLHQDHRVRGYPVDWAEIKRSYDWTANYWMRNAWPEQIRPLEWLIDRFWPIPTWPDDWRSRQLAYEDVHPWSP